MPQPAVPYLDNAPGPWFVDRRCIDCGTCRVVAPAVFGEAEDHAFVRTQPADAATRHRAGMALAACPTAAIGTSERVGLKAAATSFPDPVPGLPDVRYCGYANEDTYGASSWLIQRPDGNVLIDVPRPVRPLLERIRALGGVRWMFLTHRDDVAGHDQVARYFGAERWLHAADVDHHTVGVEHPFTGQVRLADDLLLLPVPGHTAGSAALLYRDEVLFSGDHVWGRGPLGWAAEGAAPVATAGPDSLGAGRSVCWSSWTEQTASMERLLGHRFAHILPGHGRPWHGGHAAREPALRSLLAWMRSV